MTLSRLLLPSLGRVRGRLGARAAVTVGIAHEAGRTASLGRRHKHSVVLLLGLQLIHIFIVLSLDDFLRRLNILFLNARALLINARRNSRASSLLIVLATNVALFFLDHFEVLVRRRARVSHANMLHPFTRVVRQFVLRQELL